MNESLSQSAEPGNPNPLGICFCGCGRITPIAAKTTASVRKGNHYQHCRGHKGNKGLLLQQGLSSCARCGEVKPLSQFYMSPATQRPLTYCKTCSLDRNRENFRRNGRRKTAERTQYEREWYREKGRHRFRERKYGLSAEDFERMLADQNGTCAICETPAPDEQGRSLHVDHDHATGAVRGLLCSPCNLGIGTFKDDPATLERAANYLRRGA